MRRNCHVAPATAEGGVALPEDSIAMMDAIDKVPLGKKAAAPCSAIDGPGRVL
jgi:hypothetical protein